MKFQNLKKKLKNLSYSIQDETIKKYVLEDFLEKIKKLTPIQSSRHDYKYSPYKKKKDYQILKETKLLHQKRKNLSRIQIIEFSILYIILNYLEIASRDLEELSQLEFLSEKNETLKNLIITSLTEGNEKETIISQIHVDHKNVINEVNENSNVQLIIKNKNEEEISNLLKELIEDHNEQSNLRKIESLEEKLINNLDESSYSELIKLKSQLNRE